jgi:hypothetical protein
MTEEFFILNNQFHIVAFSLGEGGSTKGTDERGNTPPLFLFLNTSTTL